MFRVSRVLQSPDSRKTGQRLPEPYLDPVESGAKNVLLLPLTFFGDDVARYWKYGVGLSKRDPVPLSLVKVRSRDSPG